MFSFEKKNLNEQIHCINQIKYITITNLNYMRISKRVSSVRLDTIYFLDSYKIVETFLYFSSYFYYKINA